MILPKHDIIGRKVVSGHVGDAQFQPAGVDLTLKEVHEFTSAGAIDFDNSERKLSETRKLEFKNDWLELKKGAYKVVFNEVVEIPGDCAALGFPRSSLLRCGCVLYCAVWDPGYKGRSESILIVENPLGVRLKKNARVIQLVFFKLSEKAKELYAGKFHNENL